MTQGDRTKRVFSDKEEVESISDNSAEQITTAKVRFTKELKANVIDAIVNGELWIEEAMLKYKIEDRKVVVTWLRRYLRENKKM